MKYDPRSDLLFVAGGATGRATVYAGSSGPQIAFYQFRPPSNPPPALPTTVINDVVLTREAAYFTESTAPFLYRVALGPGGEPSPDFEEIRLTANFGVPGGCAGSPIRANGIDAVPSGKHLIVLHTSEGQLYRIDTATHTVAAIELGTDDLCSGDGILLDGNTLYVVQNVMNRIAVVALSPDHLSGRITRYITEPFASDPTTKCRPRSRSSGTSCTRSLPASRRRRRISSSGCRNDLRLERWVLAWLLAFHQHQP
jgi:sugar lactone lactonase YvrE